MARRGGAQTIESRADRSLPSLFASLHKGRPSVDSCRRRKRRGHEGQPHRSLNLTIHPNPTRTDRPVPLAGPNGGPLVGARQCISKPTLPPGGRHSGRGDAGSPPQKSRVEGRMYYTQIIRIPRRGISPSPPGGSRIPPGGIRSVLYMYPRSKALFEGGCRIPPAK
jgi:hypothetical protein